MIEIQSEHDKLKQEYERVVQMKAAYNADKKALIDRINELEHEVQIKDSQKSDLEQRLSLLE